jgi:hypothetical protein
VVSLRDWVIKSSIKKLLSDSFDNILILGQDRNNALTKFESSQRLFEQLFRSTTNHQTTRVKTDKSQGKKTTAEWAVVAVPPGNMWFTISHHKWSRLNQELCLASGRRHDGQCLRHRRHGSQRRFKDVLRASRLHNAFHLHKHCKGSCRSNQNYLSMRHYVGLTINITGM